MPEANDDSVEYLHKYDCVRVFSQNRAVPVLLPHKAITKEEVFVPNEYKNYENPPRYRIVTINEMQATPYLVLNETNGKCEYVGYFESIESAHIFGETRSVERFNESV